MNELVKRLLKAAVFVRALSAGKNATGAKGVVDDASARTRIARNIDLVCELIEEGNLAMAAAYLFSLHKNHIEEWIAVKRGLLSLADGHRELSVITELLISSKKITLSESAHLFPGLAELIESEKARELLD